MEIVNIENGKAYTDGIVAVDDVIVKYIQSNDCTEDTDVVQELTISSRNNGCARFINIKTDNWSISDTEEISKIIEDFKKRASF